MKIIKELEYNEKEKQISFSLYDKTWCDTESYGSKNSKDMEKLKKEIARNIILQQIEIKVGYGKIEKGNCKKYYIAAN